VHTSKLYFAFVLGFCVAFFFGFLVFCGFVVFAGFSFFFSFSSIFGSALVCSSSYSNTWIAPSGHWASHVLQSMQSLALTGTDLPLIIS